MFDPKSPLLLLVNNVISEKELERIAKKGRLLGESEIDALKTSKIWRMDKSDLDDYSLNLKDEELPVEEIYLMENSFTEFPIVNGKEVRKMDFTENTIRKIRLETKDFPKLQLLDLSNNQIENIDKL